MTWKTCTDDATAWNIGLQRFADYNIYQSFEWGRYKELRGWRSHRLQAGADGRTVAMLQALVRTYPIRTTVAWCPGGPAGGIEVCSRGMMRRLGRHLGARMLYCRATFPVPWTSYAEGFLLAEGWSRPARPVGTNTTVVWDLRKTEDELLAGLNRNWRYSLRQAHKAQLPVEHLAHIPTDEVADLMAAMHVSKGIGAAIRPADVAGMFRALGAAVVAYGCRNAGGRLVAFHSCAVLGARAWELTAATSEEGRGNGASFAALWALVLHCRRMNITHYDLAGVDPDKAPGVANFKRWTGAQPVEWLGEWEWSTLPFLRRAVAVAMGRRSGAALP